MTDAAHRLLVELRLLTEALAERPLGEPQCGLDERLTHGPRRERRRRAESRGRSSGPVPRGVLVTLKRDGRPQLSNVGYLYEATSRTDRRSR